MATKTPNYNLVKPSETDFYDIAVMNDNSDTIDAALHGLSLNRGISTAEKGAPDGVATLNTSGKVPVVQLPDASTTVKGIVQLSSSVNSDSTNAAANSFALKQVNDRANAAIPKTAIDRAPAIATSVGGTAQAITLTVPDWLTSIPRYAGVVFTPAADASNPTIAINGGNPVPVVGKVKAAKPATLRYDGGNFFPEAGGLEVNDDYLVYSSGIAAEQITAGDQVGVYFEVVSSNLIQNLQTNRLERVLVYDGSIYSLVINSAYTTAYIYKKAASYGGANTLLMSFGYSSYVSSLYMIPGEPGTDRIVVYGHKNTGDGTATVSSVYYWEINTATGAIVRQKEVWKGPTGYSSYGSTGGHIVNGYLYIKYYGFYYTTTQKWWWKAWAIRLSDGTISNISIPGVPETVLAGQSYGAYPVNGPLIRTGDSILIFGWWGADNTKLSAFKNTSSVLFEAVDLGDLTSLTMTAYTLLRAPVSDGSTNNPNNLNLLFCIDAQANAKFVFTGSSFVFDGAAWIAYAIDGGTSTPGPVRASNSLFGVSGKVFAITTTQLLTNKSVAGIGEYNGKTLDYNGSPTSDYTPSTIGQSLIYKGNEADEYVLVTRLPGDTALDPLGELLFKRRVRPSQVTLNRPFPKTTTKAIALNDAAEGSHVEYVQFIL